MTRTLFAAALFATVAAAPAFAADAPVRTFVRDGVTYSYQTIEKGDRIVLQGVGNTRNLRLEVRGNQVSGVVEGDYVSFEMPEAKMAAASAQ
jgi:hypothetical protein